ncbi:melanocyte-stimulating hormone receptor-like [Bombina bombina]|uniref:melanocyte-stimulating hormone receptor n=1 Tax=Bombina bombina TaxID=8345 RepID=UPI00235A67FE|nr:melanocyte-stimulating hormone receptor [Bombina bombina]XP_053552367.1 melanocyte-stimulating hormone receptor-like [Bombina bombina]
MTLGIPNSNVNFSNNSLPTQQPNQTNNYVEIPEELFLTLCVFSLLENIMVVVAIMKNHNLHSPMYYFICCLAVSDMLVSISHLGETLIMVLLNHGLLKVEQHMLKQMDNIFDMMICCSLVTSLSFLGAIAVDRYITIFYALRYHSIMTLRSAGIAIASIWLASTVCSIIFIIYHESDAVVLCLIVFFLFMLALMVALYIHMFLLARRHARSISALQKGKRSRINPHLASANMKGAITLTMLLGIFFLCWGPLFLHLTLFVSCPKNPICNSYFRYFHFYLILIIFNSVIDPLVYAFRSQELRKTLKDIILCSW